MSSFHHTRWQTLKVILLTACFFSTYQVQAAQCEFNVINEWRNGYTGQVRITNNTSQAIEGWQVGLHFQQGETIGSAWNTNLSGSNPYTFTNKAWNAKIAPQSTKSFGFNGTKPNDASVSQPVLSGICNADSDERPFSVDINASTLSGQAPLTIDFSAITSASSEEDVSYLWHFAEQAIALTKDAQHTFEQAGEYSVTVFAVNGEQESQAQISVSVTAAPPETAQCELTIENEWNSGFRARVDIHNAADVAIDGWQVLIQFQDATKITGVWHGNHSGSNPYTVVNEQYNPVIGAGQTINFGFNAEKSAPNTPASIPALGGFCSFDGTTNNAPTAVATASVTSGEGPLSVTFDAAQSSDIDGDTLSYLWDFGDGNTSTQPQATHIFNDEGNYTVNLTVNDGTTSSSAAPIAISVSAPQISLPYSLDAENSSLFFVSTKKEHTVETHTFTTLSGDISTEGDARLLIDLSSVDTGVETRDERMREHLFVVGTYPQAQVSLTVDYNTMKAVPVGSTQHLDVEATLDLFGTQATINTEVQISRLSSSRILVQNTQPILLNATDFGLEAGVETLRSLANLTSISYAVPVNFNLVFQAQAEEE